jgi:uncharacterized protein
MAEQFLLAAALMLVLEGLMPLLAPRAWRETIQRVAQLADGQIRFFGLAAVAGGATLYWLFH